MVTWTWTFYSWKSCDYWCPWSFDKGSLSDLELPLFLSFDIKSHLISDCWKKVACRLRFIEFSWSFLLVTLSEPGVLVCLFEVLIAGGSSWSKGPNCMVEISTLSSKIFLPAHCFDTKYFPVWSLLCLLNRWWFSFISVFFRSWHWIRQSLAHYVVADRVWWTQPDAQPTAKNSYFLLLILIK